jgi:hypothetical protein
MKTTIVVLVVYALAVVLIAVSIVKSAARLRAWPPPPNVTTFKTDNGILSSTYTVNAAPEEPLNPKLARLAAYAKTHGIRWRIYCTSTETEERYTGWAVVHSDSGDFEEYKEDGAKPGWMSDQHPTQAGVASDLYRLLQHRPNWFPGDASRRTKARTTNGPTVDNVAPSHPVACHKDITSENVGQHCAPCGT